MLFKHFFHKSAFTICTFWWRCFYVWLFLLTKYFYTLLWLLLRTESDTPSTTVHTGWYAHYSLPCSYLTVLPHTARPCQLEHATQLQCVFTHSCSSHSRADIHNSRWSSVFAPLWTRCWCPRLSGKTSGPPWWPRPPPGTWAVWAAGWCPKAFWGSRRATCASRCKKREQEEEEGLAALEDKVRPPR